MTWLVLAHHDHVPNMHGCQKSWIANALHLASAQHCGVFIISISVMGNLCMKLQSLHDAQLKLVQAPLKQRGSRVIVGSVIICSTSW